MGPNNPIFNKPNQFNPNIRFDPSGPSGFDMDIDNDMFFPQQPPQKKLPRFGNNPLGGGGFGGFGNGPFGGGILWNNFFFFFRIQNLYRLLNKYFRKIRIK